MSAPAVELRNLTYAYPTGGDALRGLTLSIPPGECVALVGPNGAGKSTLLQHLNGLLPDPLSKSPAVFIAGQPVTAQTLADVRRRVGLLFQDPDDQLFCPTVFEDVAFGPRQLGVSGPALERAVAAALASVGLVGFERRSPHHLSGGEKRRVCLAGVLVCEPDILVLDEPTSGLDPRSKRELVALLKAQRATRLVATHDLELVCELCTRVIVIDGGQVVADGKPGQVLSDEPLMLQHGLEKPHSLQHHSPQHHR
jgi:energy-coupling factor transporter ATP-binding protein EcfA2